MRLYGELDDARAYYYNVNHGSLVTLQGADLTSNRWGIKGTEDLGNGIAAMFNLESGFDTNSGELSRDGRMFGRNAWIGLSSTSLGTVTIGRQLDTSVDLIQPLTADGYGPAFSTPSDADNNDNTFRVQNSIKYTSPIYNSLQCELMYGLGGVAGNISSRETSSGSVAYTRTGLSLAAGYVFTKNDGRGGVGTADTLANNSVTPLYDGAAFVGSRLISQVAVQYEVEGWTGNVRYGNAQWKPYASFVALTRKETFNTGAASLAYLVTPSFQLDVGYTYTKSSGASSAVYHTVAAGAEYYLSRRTTAYAIGGYSHAHGTTFSADGDSVVAAAGSVGDLEPSPSTPNQIALIVGITHRL